MKYDWMLMAGSAPVPVAKGTNRSSSPARLARTVRRHATYNPKQERGLSLWYRPCSWRGRPLRAWQLRPLSARAH